MDCSCLDDFGVSRISGKIREEAVSDSINFSCGSPLIVRGEDMKMRMKMKMKMVIGFEEEEEAMREAG